MRRLSSAAREVERVLTQVLGPLSAAEAITLAAVSSFAEELFFRGAMQDAWGFLPTTLLFALLHSGPSRQFRAWTLFAAAAGLLFGGLVLWRGNLLAAMLTHFFVNAINLIRLASPPGESGRLPGVEKQPGEPIDG
jgi:membrane protease YdiL (CAAX protease family)